MSFLFFSSSLVMTELGLPVCLNQSSLNETNSITILASHTSSLFILASTVNLIAAQDSRGQFEKDYSFSFEFKDKFYTCSRFPIKASRLNKLHQHIKQ